MPSVSLRIDLGCYVDAIGARTLVNNINVASWTIDSCVAAVGANFQFAGVEWGGECCTSPARFVHLFLPTDIFSCFLFSLVGGANSIIPSIQLPASACTMTCNDNPSQQCGGNLAIDIYQSNRYSPPLPTK